ncbi:helix-turn-helix domain-containing protein [Halobacteriaceae archaeon GCM10025711]
MPRTKLTVTLPSGSWMRELSTAHPDATFQVLAALPADDTGIALVKVHSPDYRAVVADLEARPTTVAVEPLDVTEDAVTVEIETAVPLLLGPVQESAVPLETPFPVQDGVATLQLTASRDRLSSFVHALDEAGMTHDVLYVRETGDDESLLTDYQSRLLRTAIDAGYYDTPRRTTLTELADQVGIAKSTASEMLHRAEERVMKRFTEREPVLARAVEP